MSNNHSFWLADLFGTSYGCFAGDGVTRSLQIDGQQRLLHDVLDLQTASASAREDTPGMHAHMGRNRRQKAPVGELIAIKRKPHQTAPLVVTRRFGFLRVTSCYSR
jgi:hypothetical protein